MNNLSMSDVWDMFEEWPRWLKVVLLPPVIAVIVRFIVTLTVSSLTWQWWNLVFDVTDLFYVATLYTFCVWIMLAMPPRWSLLVAYMFYTSVVIAFYAAIQMTLIPSTVTTAIMMGCHFGGVWLAHIFSRSLREALAVPKNTKNSKLWSV